MIGHFFYPLEWDFEGKYSEKERICSFTHQLGWGSRAQSLKKANLKRNSMIHMCKVHKVSKAKWYSCERPIFLKFWNP